ncbi:MAG: hypothetical protein ACPGGA_08235, partial [Balneolaceae bacterium]
MNLTNHLLIVLLLLFVGCSVQEPNQNFSIGAWTGAGIAETEEDWRVELEKYSSYGLTDLFLSGSIEETGRVVQYASDYDIDIHAWVWTL